MTNTAKYLLQSGKHSAVVNGEEVIFTKGDWLDLTEAQAKAFGDKVKAKVVIDAENAVLQAQLANAEPKEPETPKPATATAPATPTK